MSVAHQQAVNEILTPLCTIKDNVDSWQYFLASGLAVGYLDNRPEVGKAILAQMEEILGAKLSNQVHFEEFEIVETAGKVFQAIPSIQLSPIELVEAIVNNAIHMAQHYAQRGFCSVDASWTCFKLGWEHSYMALADQLSVHTAQGETLYTANLSRDNRILVTAPLKTLPEKLD